MKNLPKLSLFLCTAFSLLITNGLTAQNEICEEMNLEIFVDPTDVNSLLIQTNYLGQESVNYPSFEVYQDGNLLGNAETFYFLLAGEQVHTLALDAPFNAGEEIVLEVLLFSGFGSNEECSITWTGIPYDDSGCSDTVFSFTYGASFSQDIAISITNLDGESVLSYSALFGPGNVSFSESLCLPKDCYTLQIETDGQPFSATCNANFSTESFYVYESVTTDPNASSFETIIEIWEGCVVSVSEEASSELLSLFPNPAHTGDWIYISSLGTKVQRVEVYDISGRLEHNVINDSNNRLRFLSAGPRVVNILLDSGDRITRRIVVR